MKEPPGCGLGGYQEQDHTQSILAVSTAVMRLCPRCKKIFLPYLMILLVAGLAGFMTGLTLDLSGVSGLPLVVACAGVFLVVGSTLLHYVIACMRRHCREGGHARNTSEPLS